MFDFNFRLHIFHFFLIWEENAENFTIARWKVRWFDNLYNFHIFSKLIFPDFVGEWEISGKCWKFSGDGEYYWGFDLQYGCCQVYLVRVVYQINFKIICLKNLQAFKSSVKKKSKFLKSSVKNLKALQETSQSSVILFQNFWKRCENLNAP